MYQNDHLDDSRHWIDQIGSPEDCQKACFGNSECIVWSYTTLYNGTKQCYLKSDIPSEADIFYNTRYISGPKTCDGKYSTLFRASFDE